jgi:tetratricopeptide (TPR) repeat protein
MTLNVKLLQLTLIAGMLTLLAPREAVAGGIELTTVRGQTLVQRKGASNFSAVSGSTILQMGDWVKTAPGGVASITCPDSSRRPVITGGTPKGVASYCRGNSLNALRAYSPPVPGGNEPEIPYIISPRYTLLLAEKPLLRWNPVAGATAYTVSLYGRPKVNGVVGNKVKLWETRVNGTEVVYGGEQLLQPGVDYWLVVVADNGQSSDKEKVTLSDYQGQIRGVSGLRFQRVGQEVVSQVQAAAEEIKTLNWTEEEKALALANEYSDRNLYAEAIATLEVLIKQGSTTLVVYRTLGDFYGSTGLNLIAEQNYIKAIKLAATKQNTWEKVTAQDHLGALYAVMNRKQDALRLSKEALAGYQALGDMDLVNSVQQRIQTLP